MEMHLNNPFSIKKVYLDININFQNIKNIQEYTLLSIQFRN